MKQGAEGVCEGGRKWCGKRTIGAFLGGGFTRKYTCGYGAFWCGCGAAVVRFCAVVVRMSAVAVRLGAGQAQQRAALENEQRRANGYFWASFVAFC